jgi:hypothetical protein
MSIDSLKIVGTTNDADSWFGFLSDDCRIPNTTTSAKGRI